MKRAPESRSDDVTLVQPVGKKPHVENPPPSAPALEQSQIHAFLYHTIDDAIEIKYWDAKGAAYHAEIIAAFKLAQRRSRDFHATIAWINQTGIDLAQIKDSNLRALLRAIPDTVQAKGGPLVDAETNETYESGDELEGEVQYPPIDVYALPGASCIWYIQGDD